jgi:L-ribulose-5-phosphate 4-epimerase
VIVRRFAELDPADVPAALVRGHGPFCWARSARAAADLAVILEEVACMAWHTVTLAPDAPVLPRALGEKHFLRKHGPEAYYGQRERQ